MSTEGRRPSLATRLLARRGASASLLVLLVVVGLALAAPLLPLPPASELSPADAGQPPHLRWTSATQQGLAELAAGHPLAAAARRALFGESALVGLLGSDELGRDVAARVVWGARVSLLVGLAATLVALLLGTAWGVAAGWAGGRTDQILMRLVDVFDSLPSMLLVMLLVSVLREDALARSLAALGLDQLGLLLLVLGAVSWLGLARLVRAAILSLRAQDFVLGAQAVGASRTRIVLRHLLPNLWGLILVALTLTVPRVILAEAFLSFLGLGVEPPAVSWGILASQGLASLTPLSVAWWLIVFPGAALALTLGALNQIGDALRDALDPRLTSKR